MNKILKAVNRYKLYLFIIVGVISFALIFTTAVVSKGGNEPVEPANTDTIKFNLPVCNATIYKTYNENELQYNKTLNCWEIHKALDLVANAGDSVVACYDGEVTNIYSNYLDGTTIEITHADGLVSVYSGLNSETKVNVGDMVSNNQEIATVGLTIGNESEDGSHVHFELIKDGEKINPLNYIEMGLKD